MAAANEAAERAAIDAVKAQVAVDGDGAVAAVEEEDKGSAWRKKIGQ